MGPTPQLLPPPTPLPQLSLTTATPPLPPPTPMADMPMADTPPSPPGPSTKLATKDTWAYDTLLWWLFCSERATRLGILGLCVPSRPIAKLVIFHLKNLFTKIVSLEALFHLQEASCVPRQHIQGHLYTSLLGITHRVLGTSM